MDSRDAHPMPGAVQCRERTVDVLPDSLDPFDDDEVEISARTGLLAELPTIAAYTWPQVARTAAVVKFGQLTEPRRGSCA